METKQKPIGTVKTYPDPIDQSVSEEKQQITTPMAMAELEIMKVEGAKSAADQNPKVKSLALLLAVVLGITLFSQISSFLMIKLFSSTQTSFFSAFVGNNGVLGITILLIQVIAIFVLLFTRNTSYTKIIILVVGISFGITLVKGIVSFRIGPNVIAESAILVVNFLILRKIVKVYPDL